MPRHLIHPKRDGSKRNSQFCYCFINILLISYISYKSVLKSSTFPNLASIHFKTDGRRRRGKELLYICIIAVNLYSQKFNHLKYLYPFHAPIPGQTWDFLHWTIPSPTKIIPLSHPTHVPGNCWLNLQ